MNNNEIPDNWRRALDAISFALRLSNYDGWAGFTGVMAARLISTERGALAWAVMQSLEPEQAERVAHSVLGGAGMPIPLLGDMMEEAGFWADHASLIELKAYGLASFNRLPPEEQAAFLDHVAGRRAA